MTGYKRALWTVLVVALWGLLGGLSQYEWNIFAIDSEGWKTILVGIIAGLGMFATNWLAPFITQYGLGKE